MPEEIKITPEQRLARFDHWFSPEKVENASLALSDILCWMDGFLAGGGTYNPGSLECLRDLNIGLKQISTDKSSSFSHQ
jgi:hypothetical protein